MCGDDFNEILYHSEKTGLDKSNNQLIFSELLSVIALSRIWVSLEHPSHGVIIEKDKNYFSPLIVVFATPA